MKSERGPALTCLVSPTTVVHHRADDDEYWTVFTGTTVVAYCTTAEQARNLADTLNDAKQTGDQYVRTREYRPPRQPAVAVGADQAPSEGVSH